MPIPKPETPNRSAYAWTRADLWIAVAIVVAVLVVYWPVRHFGFVHIDDGTYLTDNPHAQHGLTIASAQWAMTSLVLANYMPVALLSFLSDVSLWGMNAGVVHLENAAIHALSAAGWYLLWVALTARRGRSAMVAALFALHPMRVEPVAWVSCRGDLLCMLLGVASLNFYARFVCTGKRSAYAAALVLFVLAILSKTIAMVLPGIMLLLNVWPLRRVGPIDRWITGGNDRGVVPVWSTISIKRLVAELGAFVVLGLGAAALGLFGRVSTHASLSLGRWSAADRLDNVFVGYCRYLGKAVWPQPMLMLYPLHAMETAGPMGAAVGLLGLLTFLAVRYRRRRPYLLVGWLWFLGASLPTIGFTQSGGQAIADRYTYMPYVGLFVAIVWAFAEAAARWHRRGRRAVNVALFVLDGLALLACTIGTRRQLPVWQDSFSLFSHEVAFEPNVADADAFLADEYRYAKQYDDAIAWYQRSVDIDPDNEKAQTNLAGLLMNVDARAALPHFEQSARLNPDASSWWNLAVCQQLLNLSTESATSFARARRLDPSIDGKPSPQASTLTPSR